METQKMDALKELDKHKKLLGDVINRGIEAQALLEESKEIEKNYYIIGGNEHRVIEKMNEIADFLNRYPARIRNFNKKKL
jgi:hypothetical protein